MAAYSATRDRRPRFTVPADSITLAESFNLDPDQVLDPESLVPALPGPSGSGRGTATSTSSAGPSSSAANPVDVPATSHFYGEQLIALLAVAKQPHHRIRLNAEFKSDLMLWQTFATRWNGSSLFIPHGPADVTITSDASGSWGCGAWYGTRWFQLKWEGQIQSASITVKELLPIIIASVIWGPHFSGKRVLSNCDNSAVVTILNSRYTREKQLMQLLRSLFFLEAYFQFQLSATHIPGVQNVCADDLSRNRLPAFREKVPHADKYPSHIPSSLMQWLLLPGTEWTSPTWMQQFSSFVRKE